MKRRALRMERESDSTIRVSAIICVYNGAATIRAAVNSALKLVSRLSNRRPDAYEAWLFTAWYLYFELRVLKPQT